MPTTNPLKKIIHMDMDCFYAAVELLDRPEYMGRPLAVGGAPNSRGVLCTCNYEARKFGIHSAMSSAMAVKKCPRLVIVPPSFSKYVKISNQIREIFKSYTSVIEPLSLDEAYLDVTNCKMNYGSATLIANEIRQRIFEKTKLTCSAGVAPNKFLAKVASDWKKPNGLTVITPENVEAFVKDLPVGKINGVGKVMQNKLNQMGLFTCIDIRNLGCQKMQLKFGKHGNWLYELSCGIDSRAVATTGQRKSLSLEHTFQKDLSELSECQRVISQLVLELRERILSYEKKLDTKQQNLPVLKNIVVKVKFKDFTSVTRESILPSSFWPCLKDQAEKFRPLYDLVFNLLKVAFETQNGPVRLLGLGVKFAVEDSKKEQGNSNQLWLL